jgi:hypothetical protein
MKIYTTLASLILWINVSPIANAIEIPLQLDDPHWQILMFDNIPANQVSQTRDGLKIEINKSASPLIYVFDEPQTVKSVSAMGKMGQLPAIPMHQQQGDKGADDYPLRIGLVIEGEKTLNFMQRLISAEWVKTLFDLAPDGTGIDHVFFLTLSNGGEMPGSAVGESKKSGLFAQTVVKQVNPNESFDLYYTLDTSTRVIALWISADGDDTESMFELEINSISLN